MESFWLRIQKVCRWLAAGLSLFLLYPLFWVGVKLAAETGRIVFLDAFYASNPYVSAIFWLGLGIALFLMTVEILRNNMRSSLLFIPIFISLSCSIHITGFLYYLDISREVESFIDGPVEKAVQAFGNEHGRMPENDLEFTQAVRKRAGVKDGESILSPFFKNSKQQPYVLKYIEGVAEPCQRGDLPDRPGVIYFAVNRAEGVYWITATSLDSWGRVRFANCSNYSTQPIKMPLHASPAK